jgi:hypothetical protein
MNRTVHVVCLLLTASLAAACTPSAPIRPEAPDPWAARSSGNGAPAPAPETVRPPPPATPADAPPGPTSDSAAWRAALRANGSRIVVSREDRRLWLMRGDVAVFAAGVAVGKDEIFRYGNREWDFNTPTGQMRVRGKETDPLWVPPDWHYLEKAVERDLEPVQLRSGSKVPLSDGTVIEVRGNEVGRVNQYGHWRAFTPGGEIIFDDKIFIPPIGSPQRRIAHILGTHRLILGDGYLIHGTPYEDSIGEWASHGCIRMLNQDVADLYQLVDVGTPVYVY